MADLLISRVAPGVALVRSVNPFDTLEIHRIERPSWGATPAGPGVYLLHGLSGDGKVTVYIGMSTTNMRSRIRSHHVSPNKNWFGVLFAVPVASALLCPAIEAELISEVTEAGVVDVIANVNEERRMQDVDDVHVEPAVEEIRDGLQLLLGSDIFTARETDIGEIDEPLERLAPLARTYKGRASRPCKRTGDDPPKPPTGGSAASVSWAGAASRATSRTRASAYWPEVAGDERPSTPMRSRTPRRSGCRRIKINSSRTESSMRAR